MHRSTVTALLSLLLAGCTVLGLEGNQDEEEALARARARWDFTRPNEYSYILERLCFCGQEAIGPVRIVVRGDSVLSRAYTASGEPVSAPFAILFGPVDSVFQVIDRALQQRAHNLDARYHARYGYPLDVDIDMVENAADDELVLHVREFAVHDLTLHGRAAPPGNTP